MNAPRKKSNPPPALTSAALSSVAGRKARKAQQKLHQAQADLHRSNEVLAEASPARDEGQLRAVIRTNAAAEEKVQDAVEDLEIVKELLHDAAQTDSSGGSATQVLPAAGQGKSGQGLKSLLPHLSGYGTAG